MTTQVCNLADFRFDPRHFGAIVAIWAHRPPELRTAVHAQWVRALRPGGVMILEAYTPSQVGRGTGGPPNREFCATAELAGLEFDILTERERHVGEGKYHQGDSSVVQMFAVRRD